MRTVIDLIISFFVKMFNRDGSTNATNGVAVQTESQSNLVLLYYTTFNSEATVSGFKLPIQNNSDIGYYTVKIPTTTIDDNGKFCSIVRVASYLFRGCINIDNVIFHNNITEIEDSTFMGCINLKTVTLPQTLKTICSSAFRECTNLKNVVLPNSLTKLCCNAFMSCVNLRNIIIPEKVTSIEASTFSCCEALESVTFNGNVCYIKEYAFLHCINLKEIKFSGNAPIVEKGAFYEVPSSCIVYYKKGTSGWGDVWYGFKTHAY